MKGKKIAIIGGGNIGISIAQGLVQAGLFKPGDVTLTRRKIHLLSMLSKEGFRVHDDNQQAVKDADFVILAVKPKQLKDVFSGIRSVLNAKKHILISVVTGMRLSDMEDWSGKKMPIFRAMPNTAIAVRQSMTCLASKNATQAQAKEVQHLFSELGLAIFIEEELMEAATVLGACGIAYSLRFIRAASQGGIEIGFDANTAQLIAAQTVKGAAALLLQEGRHPEEEIDKVTTPQGCTIAGLNEMEHQGFSSALIKGVLSSYRKIEKIV